MARFLERVALPFTGTQALPHLRMCAEVPGAMTTLGRDRTAVWHRVLRAAGLSPFAEPLVLRTAVGLVWEDRAPSVAEARLLLEAATSDAHRAAGTWARLVDAALGAPAETADTADTAETADGTALAHDLLRAFPQEIGGRERAALQLLELCRDLRTGAPEPGWTEQVRTLRDRAAPLEPAIQERALTALVERLLAPDRPGAELYAFVRSDDADLIAAYDRAARAEPPRAAAHPPRLRGRLLHLLDRPPPRGHRLDDHGRRPAGRGAAPGGARDCRRRPWRRWRRRWAARAAAAGRTPSATGTGPARWAAWGGGSRGGYGGVEHRFTAARRRGP